MPQHQKSSLANGKQGKKKTPTRMSTAKTKQDPPKKNAFGELDIATMTPPAAAETNGAKKRCCGQQPFG